MSLIKLLNLALLTIIAGAISGCAMFQQNSDITLIREPGQRRYGPPVRVSESAKQFKEYAILSSNVYGESPQRLEEAIGTSLQQLRKAPPSAPISNIKSCINSPKGNLPLDGWRYWDDFPSEALKREAESIGLTVRIFENTTISRPGIAVVFRGTDGLSDWHSNLRWLARFIPGYSDQYTLVSEHLGEEFVEVLAKRVKREGTGMDKADVVSIGHSLGGGLAQHFAYSLPLASQDGTEVPRVSRVYAFDPSPVTGWFSVPRHLRGQNAANLQIDRIFEHGEALAYIRLLQSYVVRPSEAAPAIREIRYNFIRTANVFSNHSMLLLACHLATATSSAN